MPNAVTPDEVIQRAQAGDQGAFEHLYKMHHRRVFNLCFRLVRNVEQAEDLTQEAFLQVFRKLSTFRGEAAFSSWLHHLTVNVALMELRKRTPLPDSLEALSDKSPDTPRMQFGSEDVRLSGAIDRLALERLTEGLTRHQFQHEKSFLVVLSQSVNSSDVWVVERSEEVCLAFKTCESVYVRRKDFWQKLQGDIRPSCSSRAR
jgi:RNA polymerase sigma factor (sigma-70 family)